MLKKILLLLLLASFFLPLKSPLIADARASQQKIKVGFVLPLTGPLSPMGLAFKRGVEAFFYENKKNNIEAIYENGAYDGKSSISAFYKLVNIDKASLIVVWGNTPASAIAPLAERAKVPTILLTNMPLAKDKSWVITLGPKSETIISKAHQHFINSACLNTAGISIDIGNALEAIDLLDQHLEGKLIKRVVASNESDFKSLILNMKASNVGCMLLFMTSEQADAFIKQLNQFQYYPKVIGGDIFDDADFIRRSNATNLNVGFVDGAVKTQFRERLISQDRNSSFIFSAAIGNTLALLATKLFSEGLDPNGLIDRISEVDLSDSPIEGLKFIKDTEYGAHFENDAKIYLFK